MKPQLRFLAAGVLLCVAASVRAGVSVPGAGAALSQTSDTAWTLAKTGAADTASATVTWTVTATPGA